ncbi:MAG: peroxidase family protein [Leptolyngbyaceae cyanobacterium]
MSEGGNLARDASRDGCQNRLELFVLTHFAGLWWLVQQSRCLTRWVNRFLTNLTIYKVATRPYPFSLMTLDEHIPDTDRPKKTDTYTSWESLTDRTYTGRHLPPDPDFNHSDALPTPAAAADLFRQRHGETIYSQKSTLLFPYWVQWFTDGFLRTDRDNRLKNTSNYHIDLAPVYGLNRQTTHRLRTFTGGKLKSQQLNGEEYPLFFYEDPEQGVIKEEFRDLYVPLNDEIRLPPERKAKLFAMGVERANVQIGYVMLNVICLREHNRLCDILAAAYSDWDDERLFQTARNILLATIMKIVVEDYVNHITPYHFNVILDPASFTNEKWYRENWMTIEFNFVYRWHSALPQTFIYAGDRQPISNSLWNNQMILDRGIGAVLAETCTQPGSHIGLFNTPEFLVDLTEVPTIALGRRTQLASYNDYREAYQYPRVKRFNQITGNPETQARLEALYGRVDNIELYVGLYAEDAPQNSVLGPLITRMIGIEALSHVMTNPLLAENVYTQDTFSAVGWESIHETRTLADLVNRNVPQGDDPFNITFYRG